MTTTIKTLAFSGVQCVEIDVQVKIDNFVRPSFNIVGLGDKAVFESKERVKAAISSTNLSWPSKRVVVNLAPSAIQKEGSHYDLPIALGIMCEMGVINYDLIKSYIILGELALNGNIEKVNGIIIAAIKAKENNLGLICPKVNGSEAAWVKDLEIINANNILSLINHLKGFQKISPALIGMASNNIKYPDFKDIKGQESAKRAIEIGVAGGHNILMIGSPGAGKSMLASRIAGIMPDMTSEEILEHNMINSINSQIEAGNFNNKRPYREVHHSCSMAAMVGGGSNIKPGEITLSHCGILFLDELPEFSRQVLDSLRQPLENKKITISRAKNNVTFPANFQLIAAMNPCRCGYLGVKNKECGKAPLCGQDYKNKISGPIIDRIDIIIYVPIIDYFSEDKNIESSKEIKKRVESARNIQKDRYQHSSQVNAVMENKDIDKYCILSNENKDLLKLASTKMNLSHRGIVRILKVARTIADLDKSTEIAKKHLLEAISYRREI